LITGEPERCDVTITSPLSSHYSCFMSEERVIESYSFTSMSSSFCLYCSPVGLWACTKSRDCLGIEFVLKKYYFFF